jgi:hypothetical protein
MSEEHDSHKQFVDRYFHLVDVVHDSNLFATELFAEDATFTIANLPTSTGHAEIAKGAQGLFDMVKSLKHESSRVMSFSKGTCIRTSYPPLTIRSRLVLLYRYVHLLWDRNLYLA